MAGLVLLVLQAGCTDNPSVVAYNTPKAPKIEAPALPQSAAQSGTLTWDVPSGWVEGKASSMRLASFAIPVDEGVPGDVSLVQLTGSAGGLLANVNRWGGQIGLEALSPQELSEVLEGRTTNGGIEYKFVTLTNSESEQAIVAGIYEIGGNSVFTKLTISLPMLEAALSSFQEFCDSVGTE